MVRFGPRYERCRWRVCRDVAGGSAGCHLVGRLAESDAPFAVNAEICTACCRDDVPAEHTPNGVVASLAHGVLQERLQTAPTIADLVRIAERSAWVEQFLEPSRPTPEPTQPRAWPAGAARVLHRLRGRGARIGLVGPDNLKGLGHINRDLARWLPVDRWLVPYPDGPTGDDPLRNAPRWLRGLDVLLFAESPWIDGLTSLARRMGVRVVCIPMWERLHPGLGWLRDVDRMICPTTFTTTILEEWRRRFHFRWTTHHFPWPVDPAAFAFRERSVCRRFVMVHGSPADPRRKGLDLLLGAAHRLPRIPFLVWSQTDRLSGVPANVEVRSASATNRALYVEGDVCVQLSRWEGIGLPLLECQAAGLPLITTNAAPMNEYHPLDVVPVTRHEPHTLWPRRLIAVPEPRLDDVVTVLDRWYGQNVAPASRAAHAFIARRHSWPSARANLLSLLS